MISFLKEAARWSGWEAGGLNCNPELTMSKKREGMTYGKKISIVCSQEQYLKRVKCCPCHKNIIKNSYPRAHM